MNFGEYNLELELNTCKKRVGFYIRKDIRYKRRDDLELKNLHVIIIDVLSESSTLRIVNLYRSFRPPGMLSTSGFFKAQLDLVGRVSSKNCDLDARMAHNQDYSQKTLLKILENLTLSKN